MQTQYRVNRDAACIWLLVFTSAIVQPACGNERSKTLARLAHLQALEDSLVKNPENARAFVELEQIARGKKPEWESVQVQAIEALRQVGKAHKDEVAERFVPLFCSIARDGNHGVRKAVAHSLGVFGQKGIDGVETLVEFLWQGSVRA